MNRIINIFEKILKSSFKYRFSIAILTTCVYLLIKANKTYYRIVKNKKLEKIAEYFRKQRKEKLTEFYQKHKDFKSFSLIDQDLVEKIQTSSLKDLINIMHNSIDKNSSNFDKYTIEKIQKSSSKNVLKIVKPRYDIITSKDIIISYALNLATKGDELNLIADIDLDIALKQAESSDRENEFNDRRRALEGIPFSVKDHINVKDLRSTLGYIKNLEKVITDDEEEALIVKILRRKGAIPICKSNVSQGLMSLESGNNLWGDSKNPLNPMLTPGGSSGGEAGLIISNCSPFGIATDFAGSIRIPCSFTGLYGFKPTSCRISTLGHINSSSKYFSGFNIIKPSWGPIAKSIDDIVIILENLFGQFSEDPSVSNNSFFDYEKFYKNFFYNSQNSFMDIQPQIKILAWLDYGFCETCPEIKNETMKLIEKLNHQRGYKIDIIMPKIYNKFYMLIEKLISLTSSLLNSSNELNLVREGLGEEQPYHFYNFWFDLIDSSFIYKKLLGYYYKLIGETRLSAIVLNNKFLNRLEYLEYIRLLEETKRDFYKEFIKDNYSFMIMPVMPFPAFPIGKSTIANYFNHFCILTNILDMPSGCLPLGKFHEDSDYSYSTIYKDSFAKEIKNWIENSKGLPYGIQICSLPNQDEICLNLMKKIELIIKS
jgi:Asp-tRNA(Asn)/Glu-tRNA(Gln) amidotransferase A subunit family amidase